MNSVSVTGSPESFRAVRPSLSALFVGNNETEELHLGLKCCLPPLSSTLASPSSDVSWFCHRDLPIRPATYKQPQQSNHWNLPLPKDPCHKSVVIIQERFGPAIADNKPGKIWLRDPWRESSALMPSLTFLPVPPFFV